jgi:hypothetical protein
MAAKRSVIFERIGVWWLCLALLVGCSSRGAASVSGKVTLDGAPLDDATITFVPATGGQQQAAWTTIKSGQYEIAAKDGLGTGPFRVEIRALRAASEKTNDPTLISAKEILPGKYNSKSELTVEIKPGKNTADFDLKSR